MRVSVKVTPGARADSIALAGDDGRSLIVKVTAPPDKGKANAAVVKLLSKSLRLPKSAFSIVAGEKARMKTIEIAAPDKDAEAALAKLARETR